MHDKVPTYYSQQPDYQSDMLHWTPKQVWDGRLFHIFWEIFYEHLNTSDRTTDI